MKITDDQAREIRRAIVKADLTKETPGEVLLWLAKHYGVSPVTIRYIVTGRLFTSASIRVSGREVIDVHRLQTPEEQHAYRVNAFLGDLRHAQKVDGMSKCHLWMGATSKFGHARTTFLGKSKAAYHIAWFIEHGEWPKFICHKCDVPNCCNPEHLEIGNHQSNGRDVAERERGGSLKFTIEEIKWIKLRMLELKEFEMSRNAASKKAAREFEHEHGKEIVWGSVEQIAHGRMRKLVTIDVDGEEIPVVWPKENPKPPKTIEQTKARFMKFIKVDRHGHWRWQGHVNKRAGYGTFTFEGKQRKAHVVSCRLFKGDIPAGMVVRHMCHEKDCVNPKHLKLGTYADNARDTAKADRVGNTKISNAEVIKILKHYAQDAPGKGHVMAWCRQVAKRYGVDEATIHQIITGKSRQHIDREQFSEDA